MTATLVPTVTLARVELLKNAASPMLVIARLLVVLGMTTAPPGPVYLAMFREPSLLVVNIYWACAITGDNSDRSISKSCAAQAIDVRGFFIRNRFRRISYFNTSEVKGNN